MSTGRSATESRVAFQLSLMGRVLFAARCVVLVVLLATMWTQPTTEPSQVLGIVLAFAYSIVPAVAWSQVVDRLHRHRWLAILDSCVVASLVWNVGFDGLALNVALSAVAIAGLFHGLRAALPSSAVLIGTFLLQVWAPAPGVMSPSALVGTPSLVLMLGLVATGLRRLLRVQAEAAEREARAGNQAAAADERARLAREMHDSLAKTLHGIALSAAALPRWVDRDPDSARSLVQHLSEAARTATDEARLLLSGLRDDDLRRPYTEVLADTVRRFEQHSQLAVELDVDDVPALDAAEPVLRHELTRIVGEALANAARHASPDSVRVVVGRSADGRSLSVAISDDGAGFALPASVAELADGGHFGLIGMGERAERLGGGLEVTSGVGWGTTVRVVVPLLDLARRPDDPDGPLTSEIA